LSFVHCSLLFQVTAWKYLFRTYEKKVFRADEGFSTLDSEFSFLLGNAESNSDQAEVRERFSAKH
jgi:hypothetical protein